MQAKWMNTTVPLLSLMLAGISPRTEYDSHAQVKLDPSNPKDLSLFICI